MLAALYIGYAPIRRKLDPTPAEAAGTGACGAFLLTTAYGKMHWVGFKDALIKTLEITALILVLVAACNFFAAVFRVSPRQPCQPSTWSRWTCRHT
jgi:TRAP-type mannitol/chloroaromatic compound transport system permease large subunit